MKKQRIEEKFLPTMEGLAALNLSDTMIQEEPQGEVWQCPRCGNPLDMVAEHAFMELWECAQCGYEKKVKQ
jgi:ribosomal protein S27AE